MHDIIAAANLTASRPDPRTVRHGSRSPSEVVDPAAVRRFRAWGDDPAQAAAIWAEAFDGGDFSVAPGAEPFAFRYAYFGNERLTLRSSEATGSISGHVPFLRDYIVGWLRAGSATTTSHASSHTAVLSEPSTLPSEQPFDTRLTSHRQNLIHFHSAFLEDVATEFHAGPRQALAMTPRPRDDAQALAAWRSAVADATAVIVEPTTAALVRSNAELTLARALLTLFTWRAWDVPEEMRVPSAWRIRLALDFLHERAAEDITPADAARHADMHTRTLQQATRTRLGMSPTAFIRNARLDRARADLRGADPACTSVAEIAATWAPCTMRFLYHS